MTRRIRPEVASSLMLRRVYACLVAVSAVLATAVGTSAAPPVSVLVGSTVWIAPMGGFETHLRTALAAADLPLVIVPTREQADYEVSGVSVEVPAGIEEGAREVRTTRQDTTVRITDIDSGETVFKHSVRTLVRTPDESAGIVYWATRAQTPSSLRATGRVAAARRCVRALKLALNDTP